MEITNKNFKSKLPLFLDVLQRCDFYSIDCEMSGIYLSSADSKSYTSMPINNCLDPDVFHKFNIPAQKYRLIQLGITCFIKYDNYVNDSSENAIFYDSLSKNRQKTKPKSTFLNKFDLDNTYVPCSFNFYLFPEVKDPGRGNASDTQILLDGATAKLFLAEHSMDFNKWIHDGIGYKPIPLSYYSDTSFIKYLYNNDISPPTNISMPDKDSKHINYEISSYCRSSSKPSANIIFAALLASNKQLIVHSGIFDLLFIHYTFCSDILQSPKDMKAVFHHCYPNIIDTKHLVLYSSYKLSHTKMSLGQMFYNCIQKKYFLHNIILQQPFMHYSQNSSDCSNKSAHDASYDSYMTGILYLSIVTHFKVPIYKAVNILYVYETIYDYCLTSHKDTVFCPESNNILTICHKDIKKANINDIVNSVFNDKSTPNYNLYIDCLSIILNQDRCQSIYRSNSLLTDLKLMSDTKITILDI